MILFTLRTNAKKDWSYANKCRGKANEAYRRNPKIYVRLTEYVSGLDWYYRRAEYLKALADRLGAPLYEPNYDDMLNAWVEMKSIPNVLKNVGFDSRVALYLLEAERFALVGKRQEAYRDYEKALSIGNEEPLGTEE